MHQLTIASGSLPYLVLELSLDQHLLQVHTQRLS